MPVKPLRPSDPTQVGKYRLSGRLGAGGMGEVFLGLTPGGRPVAVKLVHQVHAENPDFRRRFQQEIEAARRVNGLHTAGVVDADPAADPPWMVTAYVAGPSLDRALAEHGPFPGDTLRVLGAGIAEALEAIHETGLIHRDLKPSNILLSADGPRVIDFGIARAADASQTTAMVGTPGFMSPEMLTGETLSPASDVFAFGLVLAHAAGVRPFGEGPAPALSHRIVHQRADLTGLDDDLAGLISRCLAKDPDQRPAPARILEALAPPHLGTAWLPAPVQTMIDRQPRPHAPQPPTTPQQPPPRTTPQAARPQATAPPQASRSQNVRHQAVRPQNARPGTTPPRSAGPSRRQSLIEVAILAPSVLFFSFGLAPDGIAPCRPFGSAPGHSEPLAMSASVAAPKTTPAAAEAECDRTLQTAGLLLGTVGLVVGGTRVAQIIRRRDEG
ncbi:protein kinase [Spirillospora sp. NPDC047279]|uniref:serine/threonine-protein kinase n=1 Tax=Spirillospora sp. NPDC047279 TaxID=3155478 RepID=UPI0033E8AFE9